MLSFKNLNKTHKLIFCVEILNLCCVIIKDCFTNIEFFKISIFLTIFILI